MRKALFLLFLPAMAIMMLNGCGGSGSVTGNTCSGLGCPAILTPVSLSMTDTPPSSVSVLSFRVELTAATLKSASGSAITLLPDESGGNGKSGPVAIDLTQLQAVSQFLSVSSVPSGSYASLSLTFADPQVVIYNLSDSAISGFCAIGSICEMAPAIGNSATVNIAASPFPVSAKSNTPLSFLIDFHLNKVLQSDFSLNLGATGGVSVAQIPASTTAAVPEFGTVTGSVLSANSTVNQFTIQTLDKRDYSFTAGSSTQYDGFPSSVCASGSFSCLAKGQTVQVEEGSLGPDGNLEASQVDYVQSANQQTVEGTIIGMVWPTVIGAPPQIDLLLHSSPSSSSNLPLGGEAFVHLGNGTSYTVNANGFILPSGLSFTSARDLWIGQNVRVTIFPGSLNKLNGSSASGMWSSPQAVDFNSNSVELEPSQVTGTIGTLDSGAQSFMMEASAGPIFFPWPSTDPSATTFQVQTTTQTSYRGASPDTFAGLAKGDFVAVRGWLFPPTNGGSTPTLEAESVVKRKAGAF